ncbi:MAG: HXXEE domain-containing protein [Myxococcaceae bacterium]|nr:HXXEE domain-containing protein [Myxococcaceae bacterium]
MDTVLHDWPWVGLGLAPLLLTWLFVTTRGRARATDPAFVLGLLWPMYLVHQFEEHGVDVLGRRFAFLGDLCVTLGHAEVATCPAGPAFIFVVNVVACQVAFAVTEASCAHRPLLALFGWSVPLVNALAHLGAAVKNGFSYNPGLLTAVVLFVPLGLWAVRTALRAQVVSARVVPLVVASGVVVHGVLIGSLLLRSAGVVSDPVVLVMNALNGAVPAVFFLVASRLVQPARAAVARHKEA